MWCARVCVCVCVEGVQFSAHLQACLDQGPRNKRLSHVIILEPLKITVKSGENSF